jgi:hypothetical protein
MNDPTDQSAALLTMRRIAFPSGASAAERPAKRQGISLTLGEPLAKGRAAAFLNLR